MAIKIIKLNNGREFTFVNESRSNRSGFVHETTLYNGECLLERNKCQYYNRTWECYQYQSCMLGAVRKLMNVREEKLLQDFKAIKGYKKMTPSRREELEVIIKADSRMNDYNELYEKLGH